MPNQAPTVDARGRLHGEFMAICREIKNAKSWKLNFKSTLMPEISADNASLIHSIATTTAIIAALVSACAVILAHLTSEVQSSESDRSMAEASQQIATANQSAAQSQLKIEELLQQNAALTAQLDAAKKERQAIEHRLRPRKLTAQAQAAFQALATALAKDKVAPTVLLNIVRNDDEALAFSKQIAVALTKAGVRVQIKQLMLTKEATGVQAVLYDSPGSQQIERALRAANFATDISRSSQTPKINIDDDDKTAISAFINVFPKEMSLTDTAAPHAD